MRTRFFVVVLLAVLAVFLSLGGARKIAGLFAPTSPDEVKSALRAPLQALRAGQPQQALAHLLGTPVDRERMARTDRAMAARVEQGGGSAVDQCRRNLTALAVAIELHRADEANAYRLPRTLGDLLGKDGLSAIPTCPAAGCDTYTAGYKPDFANETFSLSCCGQAHRSAGLLADNPRYEQRYGILSGGGKATSWWPAPYRVELVGVDRFGSHATVQLKEEEGSTVRLTLRKTANGAWVLDGDGPSDDGGTMLGALIHTYRTADHLPAEVARDGTQACARGLARVATALEEWSSDHDGRYPPTLEALVPTYLPQMPACAGEGGAKLRYRVSADAAHFDLTCGGPHGDAHLTDHSAQPQAERQVSQGF